MLITFLGKTKGSKVDLPRKLSEQQNQNNFRICHWLFLYKRKIVFFYNLSKVILNKLICLPLFHFNQNIFRFQQNLFLNYKNDLCIFWLLMIKDNLNELKQFLRSWFQFPVGELVLQIGHKPELPMMETDVMRCFLVAWEGTRLRQKNIMKSNQISCTVHQEFKLNPTIEGWGRIEEIRQWYSKRIFTPNALNISNIF